ncbi:carbamoyltransferase HypF [Phenylobacterium sp.]|jgi:hydrogenase maturation protein HypF|uniref:carbamoyltransferase HypF n=1 Tax=Phenylobacterium sp. TaxID=1871053 RepID=UPI002E304EE3|nr:carbamoyltransferase HypF [Phenylobacterium sp.]HEX4711178.1 carbamoyltransferase HypF [Phenylobacterium sp.]
MTATAPLPVRAAASAARRAVEIRVRGRVQGVGFRPAVWRMACGLGLDGDVRNDAHGVFIRLSGPSADLSAFQSLLKREPPPLARIESVEVANLPGALPPGFAIVESVGGGAHTEVAPDARICPACEAEIGDPADRRFGYALTNCTHCGPRLSIIGSIPYDRAGTTMAPFAMCDACLAEYRDPADRRFHAEPIACPTCGPRVRCVALVDGAPDVGGNDIAFAASRLTQGDIVAIKGIGGYQLACDATDAAAVARLRAGKRRDGKPFALMARDLAVVRAYAVLSAEAASELASPRAPIVLLPARSAPALPEGVAPGLRTLGFMLPTSPLHVLLLKSFDRPLVMTSGNISDQPQIIDDDEVRERLAGIAAYVLTHDRAIANRVDDSVVRIMEGEARVLRRARGYAPAPIRLPAGFETAPEILAMGGELKATFCLVKDGQAILSQHQGDLEDPTAFDDYRKNLSLYRKLFDHRTAAVAADAHPEYLSSKLARALPGPLIEIQHHHAHIAACLCENEVPLDMRPVLGVALDGIGWGDDGTFWGGEFLLADYRGFRRLAALKPVAMAGGEQAIREPWRNLYAHIRASMGWPAFRAAFGALDAAALLDGKPHATLDAMIAAGVNAPIASSCGRLFDAVAAALGLCDGRQAYEGDAASRLEALAEASGDDMGNPYPVALAAPDAGGVRRLDPAPMWAALFEDCASGTPVGAMARRFHRGLAEATAATSRALAAEGGFDAVALSGGCFQNRLLFEETARRLRLAGFTVLSHRRVPANDGGLSLGQAAVAAARLIQARKETTLCA